MAKWTGEELDKIGQAEELRIAPLRADGKLQKPVIIWVVRTGDDLYVRSFKGQDGLWFRAAQERHQGRIQAGGIDKDVTLAEESDPAINDQIDNAYHTKYRRFPQYVAPMVTPEVKSTTLKLVPR